MIDSFYCITVVIHSVMADDEDDESRITEDCFVRVTIRIFLAA